MRNFPVVMIAALFLGLSLAGGAQAQSLRQQKKQLKAHQKQEFKVLRQQQKNRMRSLKQVPVSKAVLLQTKHQMQRDRRAMRDKQKDDMQDLKDRQRTLKESQRVYNRQAKGAIP